MRWREKYGPWALVTGASAGLGAEFVRQLAARGLNVVLIARREQQMAALAEGVRRIHGVETRIVPLDLTGPDACRRVGDQTGDLEIGLLVNNAGFGLSGAYTDLDPDRMVNMTVLNCVVPVLLTNHYLPLMLDRGRGGLIFLASTAAYQATPYLGVYGATKAFNLLMGESLWKEYRARGIDSLALSPGYTKTEFASVAQMKDASGIREATPPAVVALALRKLGRKPSVIHGRVNKMLNFTGRLLPRRIAIAVASAMLKGRTRL
ncbi:MAG: SDR family NAD(P)-dependent oxidoreductase [Gemmatimonadota bacterium]|nr:SDR family NAD(P)-dependent oxidoreductase [Gemmatimonadota bacterium]